MNIQQHNWQTLQITEYNRSILIITLHRPDVRNAINSIMMKELSLLWQELLVNFDPLRCIILTGSGDAAFCAGADLKERFNLGITEWQQQHRYLQIAIQAMLNCPIPIIAAVNGAAYGGGLELALASDFIYAAHHSMFAQSEVKLGIMPGAMGTQHLPRACSLRRAKELSFTGQPFTAEQALKWGIVNQCFSAEQLMTETLQTAEHISANAPLAIQQVKKALNVANHLDLKTGYTLEICAYNQLLATEDRKEGIRAFNEKRPPHFEGL